MARRRLSGACVVRQVWAQPVRRRLHRELAAAIGYYRAEEPGLGQSVAHGAYAAEESAPASAPPQPTLYLHGERDGCIDVALTRDAERHLAPGSRMEVIADAGHFLHVEKPTAVNDRILAWVTGSDRQALNEVFLEIQDRRTLKLDAWGGSMACRTEDNCAKPARGADRENVLRSARTRSSRSCAKLMPFLDV